MDNTPFDGNKMLSINEAQRVHIESKPPFGIVRNIDTSQLEYCNIVNMCIKDIGSDEYLIPDNLKPFVRDVILDVHLIDMSLNKAIDMYAYLTIKKMYIQPNTCGNREGWHIDGFMSDQKNFIWSDCDATPTEVSIGSFDLTLDHEKSIDEMYEQGWGNFNLQLKSNVLYEMNQECVHRPTQNNTNKPVLRTFIKLTYTKELFNGYGNAWNYLIPHIKPSKERSICRNHGVL